LYLGTNFMPPVIHPTQQIVNHTFSTTVVPHIHPVHTTTINHHMFQHKHYCPQSASTAEECCNQHIDCCCPGGPTAVSPMAVGPAPSNNLPPRPGFAPGGPGMGPGMAPGMGPGMAPGMGPGMAPGMGPGMAPGMGPGMAPGMGPGMAPGMGPGMAPGMGPGMAPGMRPGMAPGRRPFWR
jgi:spore coat protein D